MSYILIESPSLLLALRVKTCWERSGYRFPKKFELCKRYVEEGPLRQSADVSDSDWLLLDALQQQVRFTKLCGRVLSATHSL